MNIDYSSQITDNLIIHPTLHTILQNNITQHSIAHSTAQHSTAQHSTAKSIQFSKPKYSTVHSIRQQYSINP
jgi:hypothetical protein